MAHRVFVWYFDLEGVTLSKIGFMSDSSQSKLEIIGGEAVVADWMQRFYDRVAKNPVLIPLFPSDLTASREKQTAYMVEFLGGEKRYTEKYGKPFLRFRHRKISIGIPERDAWMNLFMETLREVCQDQSFIAGLESEIGPIATAMINHDPEKKDAYFFN